MKGNWSNFHQVFRRCFSSLRFSNQLSRSSTLSNSVRSLILSPNSLSSQIARNSLFAASTICVSTEFNFSNISLSGRKSLCSGAGDRSSFVVLKSEEEFNTALSKAQDGSLPSIFYFTAAWCGPCRLIAPVIVELSNKYPDVTTYKVDIDESGLSNAIGKLNIGAVPTLQFFKGGVKKAEIVGADVTKLRNVMEQLYK